jgi:HAD superfamily hydrolase (TIGR01509 family)
MLIMVKAVIWDNDGVLVDTEELYFKATREALSEIGIDLTPELFVEISLKQGRSTFDLAIAEGVAPEVIARLRGKRNLRYSDLLRNGVRVLDGVEDTLSRLRGKVLMGIVTSSRREHFEIIHTGTGLLHFFDFVLTREDYGKSKPNPDPFLAAVIRYGLQPENCIIVEDSERGLAAAKAAGIRCVVVPNALTKGSDFSGVYRVLESVSEVPGEVFELLRQQVDSIQKK